MIDRLSLRFRFLRYPRVQSPETGYALHIFREKNETERMGLPCTATLLTPVASLLKSNSRSKNRFNSLIKKYAKCFLSGLL
jgi:hypothetical protein